MDDLIDALDRFLEAARRTKKVRTLAPIERKLEKGMVKAFKVQGKLFGAKLKRIESKFPEEAQESKFREVLEADLVDAFFEDDDWLDSLELISGPIDAAAKAALAASAKSLIAELGMKISFSLKNPRAVEYLKAHGADLVTKIDETTRSMIKTIVTQAAEEGWSYNRTALAIQERFTQFCEGKPQEHIASRAHLVAVTEAGEAYEAGNYVVIEDLQADGIEMEKAWSTMGDDRVSEGCQENEDEGWIPADQEHASGHMHPLRFPGCRCDELYRVKEA
jgi:hypothetical protein